MIGRARALLPFIITATEMYPCSLERERVRNDGAAMLMRIDLESSYRCPKK